MGFKKKEADEWDEPGVMWYEASPELKMEGEKPPSKTKESTEKQLKLKERGRDLLEQLGDSKSRGLHADEKWMQKISSSGTTSDKLAAGVILIKEHPLSNLKALHSLITQAKKKGGKANVPVIESLRDLFLESLLPADRQLKYVRALSSTGKLTFLKRDFRDQPWYSKSVTDKHLLYWVFEDEIKTCYASFVTTLEQSSKETVDFLRDISIKTMARLLTQHPEQEKALLTHLVNKMVSLLAASLL